MIIFDFVPKDNGCERIAFFLQEGYNASMSIIEYTNTSPIFASEELPEVNAAVSGADLTVSQVADILRFSENHVSDLLDMGRIAFRWENGERLISQDNLQAFIQERERRHAALDKMVLDNIEMGLYDMESYDMESYND